MKVLLETPDRLVVEGTTMIAEVAGGCMKMGLMVLCLPVIGFVIYTLKMASDGDSALAIIALSGAAMACLALALVQRDSGPARLKASTWGARRTTFDAVARTVEISGVGAYPLQDLDSAILDQSEESGCYNVKLRFHNREAVMLSHVYMGESRVAHVLKRIQEFLARLPPRPSPQSVAPVSVPPPSVQEAQTKEETGCR